MHWEDNPFAIGADEVQGLSAERQVALLNQLIRNRASQLDLPAEQVRTTLRTNNADGGVDALVDTGDLADRILGTGSSVWQFKKSFPTFRARKRANSEIEEELAKPGVQRSFRDGAGYTLVVGEQATPRKVEELGSLLLEFAGEAGCTGSVRLIVADEVADWATDDPAVLLRIRPSLHGMKSVEEELRGSQHSSPFEPDQQRESILESVGHRLFGSPPSTAHIRLNGLAGVGKTRLALEAVNQHGYPSATFYTSGPVPTEFFDLVTAREQATATIVIDECEPSDHGRYVALAERANGRIRILTVGPGQHTGMDVYTLKPVDFNVVERIVQRATGLPEERARWVARKSNGYVKISVLIGRLVNSGTANISDLSDDLDISEVVQELISPNAQSKIALRGLSLLTRVGVEGALESEGQAIAEFVGLTWNEFRNALVDAIKQGVVSVRGRYWYISPEILAIWLAGEFWRTQPYRLSQLLDQLPSSESQESCLRRISTLGDVPQVAKVVSENLLGSGGMVQTLADLSTVSTARAFAKLVKGHPEAGIYSLQRIIGQASDEALSEFKAGRQDLVWALRSLMSRREYFLPAARLMRRLAQTENEHYFGNNATDYWAKSFLVQLGQTECPPLERLPLIDESLQNASPEVRLLGTIALASMLVTYESAGIETPDETMPPSYWVASTWAEIANIKRQAFKRLVPLLNDTDQKVRQRALETLWSEGAGLVRLGMSAEILEAYEAVEVNSDTESRKTWEAIRHILLNKQANLNGQQRELLRVLSARYFDNSLESRIKRYMGPGSPANWDEDDWANRRQDQIVAALADEANQSEGWTSLVTWLASGEAQHLHPFACRLGEIDRDRRWLSTLESAALAAPDPRILTFYLRGWSELGEDEFKEVTRLLDGWAALPDRTSIVADASLRLRPAISGATRLFSMVDSGALPASSLGWLRVGGWLGILPAELIVGALSRMLNEGTPHAISSALHLGYQIGEHFNNQIPDELRPVLWSVLENPAGWSAEIDNRFVWHRLATDLSDGEELRTVRLLVEVMSSSDLAFEDERASLLLEAGKKYPREVLDLLTPLIVDSQVNYRYQWAIRDIGLLDDLDRSVVEEWIHENGSPAAAAVSESIHLEPEELTPLVRFLLINYKDAAIDALTRGYLTGHWTGSAVPFWTTRRDAALLWANDPEQNIRDWAQFLIEHLEPMISGASIREAEERWY